MSIPTLLTIDDVREIFRCSRSKVYEMAARGDIEGISVGRHRRFTEESVENFIERQRGQSVA
jgi:excisionase family DNA binding protein